MSKFGFLKRTHIPRGEAGYRWLPLPEIPVPPGCPLPHAALLVANATQENAAMMEEALRNSKTTIDDRGAFSSAKLEKGLEEDRGLLMRHVIKGWRGMFEADEQGNWVTDENDDYVEIPFNMANCRDFLAQIQGWLLTRVKQWCLQPENFLEPGEAPPPVPDGNELGKE